MQKTKKHSIENHEKLIKKLDSLILKIFQFIDCGIINDNIKNKVA
jgi:hypothetical protein